MQAASLFDDLERVDASPCGYSESTFHFLNRARGPVWERERTLLDAWWHDFPSDSQGELRGRIRNDGNVGFRSAFCELYVHQVLRRISTHVECHPALPNTQRRPDFLARVRGIGPVVVEAKSGTGSPAELGFSPLMSAVMDAVNTLRFDRWTFRVSPESEGRQAPRTKPLLRGLTEFVESLDHDALRARLEKGGYYESSPTFEWTSGDWRIDFQPIPMREGRAGPTVGMNAAVAIWNDAVPIREYIRDKGRAYGDVGGPFVLALDVPSLFDTDHSPAEVLYGDIQIVFDVNFEAQTGTRRAWNGAWYAGNRWRQPQVSGVVMLPNLAPHRVVDLTPTLWHHPSPTYPISALAPIFRQAKMNEEAGHVDFIEPTMTPAEFFELPEDWPGPEPAFADE